MGVQCVEGAQVGDGHEDDRHNLMDHHGGSGIGQSTISRGEVPHTAQQRACGAAYHHQCLTEKEET